MIHRSFACAGATLLALVTTGCLTIDPIDPTPSSTPFGGTVTLANNSCDAALDYGQAACDRAVRCGAWDGLGYLGPASRIVRTN